MAASQFYFLKVVSDDLGTRDVSVFPLDAEDDDQAREKAYGVVENRPEYDGGGLYHRDLGSGGNQALVSSVAGYRERGLGGGRRGPGGGVRHAPGPGGGCASLGGSLVSDQLPLL